MKPRILLTALLLSLALPAAADFRTIVEGYEIAANNIRLPQTRFGTIAFKRCNTCPYETMRVSPDVSWEINGQPTTLEKFRQRLSSLDDPANRTVTVGHHLENDLIVRVTTLIR